MLCFGMRSRPRLLVFLWLVLAATAAAQDRPAPDPEQPTFRTGIQSVRVDLYVTRDGEPVRDLRRDEVQVFEDGVAQNVDTFERIVFAEPGSRPAVEPQTAPERRKLATDHRARLFVVFLTTPEPRPTVAQRQAPPRQTQSQVLDMLNGMLGPDDVIAVMTPYMRIEDLTFQRRVSRDDEAWFRDLEKDPKQSRWDACFPPGGGSANGEMKARYRELVTLQALEGLVTHLSGLRDERKHILVMSDGFRLYTKNPRLPQRGQPESGGFPIGGGGGGIGIVPRLGDSAGVSGGRIPSDCEQDLRDLASLDHSSRLDQIATYARRTNVSLYPISLLRPGSDPTRNLRLRGSFENNTTVLMQSSLKELAEDTDGLPIVNTNNVEGNLRRIVTTTSSYYLVGYTPVNATADGRFRRITVKVSRPDTSVSARAGYVAGLPAPAVVVPVETRKPPDPVDLSMRALNVSSTSALHVRPAVWTRGTAPGARTTSVWIDAELDPQLRRQRSQADGGTVEMILRPIRGGDPITRQLPVTAATNFEFELRGPDAPAPGEYSIQLQLSGAGGAPVGEVLRIVVPESTSSLGEALLLRRGPTTGPRYARTADPRFYRTDRLRLELPTDSREPATGRLRDRRGGALATPVQITAREDDSGQFRWIVADVPLTSIAPGDYAVEVTQGGATRFTAFRVVP
jgi:VWFA-related protein